MRKFWIEENFFNLQELKKEIQDVDFWADYFVCSNFHAEMSYSMPKKADVIGILALDNGGDVFLENKMRLRLSKNMAFIFLKGQEVSVSNSSKVIYFYMSQRFDS